MATIRLMISIGEVVLTHITVKRRKEAQDKKN